MNSPVSTAITVGDRYVAVRYIGKKPKKADTVLNRRVSWAGHGDVQWVPEKDAAIYIQFPDIWALAPDVEVPAGGIGGLSTLKAAVPGAPSDLHSQSPLPSKLNRAPDGPYETDPKVAAMTDSISSYAASAVAENLTVEAAVAKLTRLMKACAKLKPDDFAPDGKPKIAALVKVLGAGVSRQERDVAWHMLQQQLEKMHAAVPKGPGDAEPEGEPSDPPATTDETEPPAPPDIP